MVGYPTLLFNHHETMKTTPGKITLATFHHFQCTFWKLYGTVCDSNQDSIYRITWPIMSTPNTFKPKLHYFDFFVQQIESCTRNSQHYDQSDRVLLTNGPGPKAPELRSGGPDRLANFFLRHCKQNGANSNSGIECRINSEFSTHYIPNQERDDRGDRP